MPLSANDLYNMFGGVADTIAEGAKAARLDREEQRKEQLRQTLGGIGANLAAGGKVDYKGLAAAMFGAGDVASGTALLTKAQEEEANAKADQQWKAIYPGGGAGSGAGTPGTMPEGDAKAIEDRVVRTAAGGGLTNPNGLGALAAYGLHESKFDPANVNRTWPDPSQSGQPGTSGGIFSLRNDRLQGLYQFAATRGEQPGNISPETQALYVRQENPELWAGLQAAKTPEEAHDLMRNSWKFAGYDQPGGENAARLATTRAYAQRFQAQTPSGIVETPEDQARLDLAQLRAPLQLNPLNPLATPAAPQPNVQLAGSAPIVPAGNTPLARSTGADLFTPPQSAPAPLAPQPSRAAPTPVASDEEAPAKPAAAPAVASDENAARQQRMAALLTMMGNSSLSAAKRAQAKAAYDFEQSQVKTEHVLAPGSQLVRGGQVVYTAPDKSKTDTTAAAVEKDAALRKGREERATTRGWDMTDPNVQAFIETGKLPAAPATMKAGEQKAYLAAKDKATFLDQSIADLQKALSLNDQAYSGNYEPGAAAWMARNVPFNGLGLVDPDRVTATTQFNNLVGGATLSQGKELFGARVTNYDEKLLQDLKARPDMLPQERAAIINEMIAHRQRVLAETRADVAAMKSGTMFRKGADQTAPDAAGSAPAASTAPVRVNSAAERDKLAPGTQYVAPDGSLRVR